MAAVAPETGVGCMTPNWTLLAALDEALHRALGANYELHVMPISSEEQLRQLDPSRVTSLLQGAQAPGAVYFLSPQRVAGDFRTKHDLVHDLPLFGLMEAGKRGLGSCWDQDAVGKSRSRSMSSSPIPFLRIDFLLAAPCEADSAGDVEVWTGEVSELGVAVELQGMNSHESRDLVVDAVVASLLKGAG
eukprot:Skav235437  [mRNA]  locus=scaffold774:94504:98602:+ [translate_table: standard]